MTPEKEAVIARIPHYLDGWQTAAGESIAAQIYVWTAGTTEYMTDNGTRVVEPTGQNPEQVLEAAKVDPAAWEAARMLFAGLAEHGDPIPPPLMKFAASIMRDEWPKPASGRPKHKNLARDLRVANAVYRLNQAGIQLSQNDATQKTKSAFHLVACHALLSPAAVKTIWQNVGPHIIESKTNGLFYFCEHPLKLKI